MRRLNLKKVMNMLIKTLNQKCLQNHFKFRLKSIALLCLCLFSLKCNLFAFLDLETMNADFVLETKKIDIPGYPDAFNPSITQWNDFIYFVFAYETL